MFSKRRRGGKADASRRGPGESRTQRGRVSPETRLHAHALRAQPIWKNRCADRRESALARASWSVATAPSVAQPATKTPRPIGRTTEGRDYARETEPRSTHRKSNKHQQKILTDLTRRTMTGRPAGRAATESPTAHNPMSGHQQAY